MIRKGCAKTGGESMVAGPADPFTCPGANSGCGCPSPAVCSWCHGSPGVASASPDSVRQRITPRRIAEPMATPKNVVLFIDGTWNQAADRSTCENTNVHKLFMAADNQPGQV